jgi:hypothetical protein
MEGDLKWKQWTKGQAKGLDARFQCFAEKALSLTTAKLLISAVAA